MTSSQSEMQGWVGSSQWLPMGVNGQGSKVGGKVGSVNETGRGKAKKSRILAARARYEALCARASPETRAYARSRFVCVLKECCRGSAEAADRGEGKMHERMLERWALQAAAAAKQLS